ncbi:S16 family serine protease [Prosthecobacter vanneervenii]|uniref:Lon proteolytic domain-containing protein n=1 Tax=Prosthecobacter vanneervenii TaxID=48466 RepID=A0A7W7YE82_9BACT|nr:S16 family serine protease [Prosthecobacter vanneervenii]MBB5034567.1 hypothetical protein [Prosthecobacter vanneervenii]
MIFLTKAKYLFFLLLAGFFSVSTLGAAPPSWYQPPVGELRLQRDTAVTSAGHYSQTAGKIVLRPELAASKPSTLEMSFGKGTHITATTFDVGAGGRLVFRECQLNQVAISCQPGGEIHFENCAMVQVYFASSTGPEGTQTAKPYVRLKDCTLSQVTMESPTAVGVAATNCRITQSDLYGTDKDAANQRSNFGESVFSACKIFSPEFIVCTNKCCYRDCELTTDFPQDFAMYLPKPVLVLVSWQGIHPVTLPDRAGMAVFRSIDVTAVLEAAGTTKGGPALSSSPAPGKSLTEVAEMVPVNIPASQQMGSDAIAGVAVAGLSFKSRLTQVNGLLISQLSTGGEAGQVTRMSLSALPTSQSRAPSSLKFNQNVGDSMFKALNEVSKFSQLRHGGWPMGYSLEIGFEDKYVGKDGPSAAVACALLLEAAITGKKWDPAFAVTGDMNADGSVQPIGGVQAKIRGATKGDCKIVAVPVKNEVAVSDILVQQGPAPLVGITVFGIKTFDDALALADPEKPLALQNALTDFDNMRSVMMRDPRQITQLLRTPHAAQRLQALLTAAPNCYSAKYLLMYLQGRTPRTLSIGGSIEAAQNNAQAVVSAIDHDVDSNVSSLKGDELGNSLNKLRQLRPLLDARVWPYVDGLIAYGEVIRGALLNPVRSGARYTDLVSKANKAAGATKAAYDKLINDAQVREELGL